MKTFRNADILLPKNADMEKWSVVACDQYTSEPDYWKETSEITSGSISTLDYILPEIYLEDNDVEKRIEKIHSAMDKGIKDNVFE
ncbi:MAG: DUF1015 family protein, partial [Oscillospiraceae bacterium]|nr:DUF1015 family protein [Oscillospiraceae bacterium]